MAARLLSGSLSQWERVRVRVNHDAITDFDCQISLEMLQQDVEWHMSKSAQLQVPSPGWERVRVRGIKKADSKARHDPSTLN